MKTTLPNKKLLSGLASGGKRSFIKRCWMSLVLMAILLSGSNASAQIAQKGTATTATSTGTTLTINKPSGLAVGDLMIANIIQSDNDNANLSNATRTNWILIAGEEFGASGFNSWWGTLLYKVADAADVAASNFAFTLDSDANNDGTIGGIVAFSGVDVSGGFNATGTANSGPFDVDPGSINNGSADDFTAPSITTTTDNAMVIMFGMVGDDRSVSGWSTATSPGTLTEIMDADTTVGNDMGVSAAMAVKATSGSTGAGDAEIDGNGNDYYGAILIALRPVTIATGSIASPLCAGNAVTVPYTISGQYNTGNVFTAQLSNAAGSFAAPTNIGTVTATTAGSISATIPAGQAAGTGYRIRVVSSSPGATGEINGSNITINGTPGAVAGTAVSTCETTAVNITAGSSATNSSSVAWSSSGTGTFTNANSLTLATYTPSAADVLAGSVTITLTASPNSPCVGNATSSKTLTISKQPTATAGGSATICQNQTHQVTGASSSNGTISWTENGAGSITAGGTTLTPTYTAAAGDAGNTVTLTMHVTNAPCSEATATYTINVTGLPTANAGSTLTMCETAGSVNITGATASNNSGVLWTSSGTGSFSGSNTLNSAVYTPSAADINAGSVTLTLTAFPNAPCAGNATSNRTLTIYKLPTAAAGGSATICQNQTHQVSGASSSNGTIAWTENGAGSITAGATTLTPTYTAAAGDAGNTVTLTMTVSNGTCTPATATYTIQVLALPTASAGAAFSTCANSGAVSVTAGATASNNSGVMWSSSGTGTFANASSLTLAMYTPSAADISNGSVTITLTAFGNGSCNNATSDKVLTINPIPEATDAIICQGSASTPMNSSTVCPNNPPVSSAKSPSAGATAGTGTAWTGAANIVSDNDSNATVSGSVGFSTLNLTSQTLAASNYGFSIPSNAVINGIEVTIGHYRSGTALAGEVQDNTVKLRKAGTEVGTNLASSSNWPTGETAAVYGGSGNLWGTTWTAADINASTFGVGLAIDLSVFLGTRTANVDYINVTVYYTIPGELNWYTVSSGGSPIGTGSSFDPVGVAGSGLADTNTPGTTIYYVECSTVAGCRTPVNFVINPLPSVNFTGLDALYCEDAASATLTANHAGGTFSGAGITDNGDGTATFNPATAGVGPHSVTYSYTDGNTCTNSVAQNTNVNANVTYYQDFDNDGFGNVAVTQVTCTGAPAGYVANSTDCNDNDATKNATFPFYVDADGDTFGTGSLVSVCAVDANTPPANYSLNDTDCDDGDNTKNATFSFYVDADGDTFGTGSSVSVCAVDANTPPANYSLNDTDCDDNDNTRNATFTFYADTDNDGYGDAANSSILCAVDANTPPQAGFVADNTDCDDAANTVHPNAVEIGYNLIDEDCDGSIDEGFPAKVTTISSAQCNTTLAAIDQQLVANLVAGAQGYRWKITNMNGPDAGQVQFLDTPLRVMKLVQLPSYAFGTQYKVELAVYFAGFLQPFTASSCTVTTPSPTCQLANCGQGMTNITDPVYAQLTPYCAGYRFRVTDPLNPTNTQVIDRPIRDFRMNMVTDFVVQYGKAYNVEVALKNADGTYLAYGNVCTVTTPVFPTTSLRESQCDDYLVSNNSEMIYADSYPGAISYVFRLNGPGLPAEGVEITKLLRAFSLSEFTGLIPGATYDVKVRLIFHESDPIGPFGKTCTVVAPGLSRQIAKPALSFNAVAYPNPFAANFNISVTTAGSDDVSVKVYDMTGRLLETKEAKVSELESFKAGDNYPSGVYNVVVSQGENVKTLRVVKR